MYRLRSQLGIHFRVYIWFQDVDNANQDSEAYETKFKSYGHTNPPWSTSKPPINKALVRFSAVLRKWMPGITTGKSMSSRPTVDVTFLREGDSELMQKEIDFAEYGKSLWCYVN